MRGPAPRYESKPGPHEWQELAAPSDASWPAIPIQMGQRRGVPITEHRMLSNMLEGQVGGEIRHHEPLVRVGALMPRILDNAPMRMPQLSMDILVSAI